MWRFISRHCFILRHRLIKLFCFPFRLSKSSDTADTEKALEIERIEQLIEVRKAEFREMEDTLPHENGYDQFIDLHNLNLNLIFSADAIVVAGSGAVI